MFVMLGGLPIETACLHNLCYTSWTSCRWARRWSDETDVSATWSSGSRVEDKMEGGAAALSLRASCDSGFSVSNTSAMLCNSVGGHSIQKCLRLFDDTMLALRTLTCSIGSKLDLTHAMYGHRASHLWNNDVERLFATLCRLPNKLAFVAAGTMILVGNGEQHDCLPSSRTSASTRSALFSLQVPATSSAILRDVSEYDQSFWR
jgi:hypothetical protein